jgi:hypothetical protein
MRDEIDSRFWVEHHEAFGREIGAALVSFRGWLAGRDGSGPASQLLALTAAFAVAAITLNATLVA